MNTSYLCALRGCKNMHIVLPVLNFTKFRLNFLNAYYAFLIVFNTSDCRQVLLV